MRIGTLLPASIALIALIGCGGGTRKPHKLVFVVMDGARYTETLGYTSGTPYVRNISERIVPVSCNADDVTNRGVTRTVPGHIALSTGFYEKLANDGTEIPGHPSFMHLYLRQYANPEKVWLVTGKNKLSVLAQNMQDDQLLISANCGEGESDRDDTHTFDEAIRIMETCSPDVMFISFMEPDISGHTGIWNDYLTAITRTDTLIGKLFDYINSDPDYAGKTNMIIANDHGRHSDGINEGFRSHGCSCEGCSHIMLVAYGPDFRKGITSHIGYQQTDITATAAHLLGFRMSGSEGKVIWEFLNGE